MTLRLKILTYLIALHLLLGVAVYFLAKSSPWWVVGAEITLVISVVVFYRLLRAFLLPLDMIRTGTELIREREFGSYFRHVRHPEMDQLIDIYNRMVDQLREERLKLEEQNLFLEKVMEASPAGVITLDLDQKIQQLNSAAERLLGDRRKEWIGAHLSQLPGVFANELLSLGDGGSTVVQLHGRRRLRIRRASFYDRGVQRIFYLLEELTDELQASEKGAYDKLIRMMSHEVNNSVGVVKSLLESCGHYRDQLRDDDRPDYDRAIEVAVNRLLNLSSFMNGLAAVVRVPPPDCHPCDVVALIQDIVSLISPEIVQRNIRLEWNPPANLPVIDLDKNQIEQVLVNVLRNALEAMGEGGTLTIGLDRERGRTVLAVRDSGPGIEADVATEIFTPFFSTKRDGQGIGLTLSREILSQHGYDFSLANHRDGGAEFRIVFSAR
ncbi:MAG: ATP-binding protein [Acidobacteriota bacterium]|nr:ATP-binding protein [Acidobacteriota bacterium]